MSGGFFFNVEKWFASISVQRMSFAEKGVYLTMLFEQWREASKSLPDDPKAVADMIAVTEAQAAEVLAAWPVVRPKFETCKQSSSKIQNRVIEQTRRKQALNRQKRSDAGRIGGKASARKRNIDKQMEVNDCLSNRQAKPSDQIRLDQTRSESDQPRETREDTPPDSVPISARPVHRFSRQTIFDGANPKAHLDHIACSENQAWCVPRAVHAELSRVLAPKFSDDVSSAGEALKAWYPRVWAQLPAHTVVSDAFKFWRAWFEREQATKAAPDISPVLRRCKHTPPCRDEAEHTRLDMAERRAV